MSSATVVVEGGGSNLYQISDSGGRYTVYKISVNLFLPNTSTSIGSARSFDQALSIIRSHSGKEIKKIE